MRNKFDTLADQIKGNVDILLISYTKLDESFPVDQFKIPGFTTPLWRDRNEHGGGIMVFFEINFWWNFVYERNVYWIKFSQEKIVTLLFLQS